MIFGNIKKSMNKIFKKRLVSQDSQTVSKGVLESEKKYRELADSLPQIIFETDSNYNLTFLNNNAISVFGYSDSDFAKGMQFDQLFIEENAVKIRKCIKLIAKEKKLHSCERKAKKKDGTTFPALMHVAPILNEKQEFSGLRGIIIDISDRKEMEVLLKDSENKYRNIIENSNDPIWIGDTEGNITFFNREAEKMFGYRIDELKNKKYEPLVAKEDLPRLKKIIASAFSGNPEQFEVKIKKKDGELIDVWIKLNIIRTNGQVQGLIATGRNITEKKKSEELLKESEERYRSMIENSTDIVYMLDTQGKITYINPAAEKCSGSNKEQIIGKRFDFMLSSDEISRVRSIFERTLQGEKNNYEARINKPDKSTLLLSISTAPIYKEGKIIGTVSFAKNITEQKIQEEKLQREYSFRKSIENSLGAGIAMVDLESIMTYVNPSFCKMTGYDEKDLVGKKPPFIFWHPDDRHTIAEGLKKKIKGEVPIGAFELKFRKKNGETLFVMGMHSPIKNSKDETTAWLGVFIDITERKKQEAELIKMKKAVEYSNEIIFMTDPDGLITYINPEFTKIYGYSKEEIIAKATYKILRGYEISQEEHENIKKKIFNRQVIKSKLLNKTKDGRFIKIIDYTNPVVDDNNNLIGFLAIQHEAEE